MPSWLGYPVTSAVPNALDAISIPFFIFFLPFSQRGTGDNTPRRDGKTACSQGATTRRPGRAAPVVGWRGGRGRRPAVGVRQVRATVPQQSVLGAAPGRGQETVRAVLQAVPAHQQPHQPRARAHGRKAVRVCGVRQGVLAGRQLAHARASALRRRAVRVRHVPPAVHAARQPGRTQEHARRAQAVRVRRLSEIVLSAVPADQAPRRRTPLTKTTMAIFRGTDVARAFSDFLRQYPQPRHTHTPIIGTVRFLDSRRQRVSQRLRVFSRQLLIVFQCERPPPPSNTSRHYGHHGREPPVSRFLNSRSTHTHTHIPCFFFTPKDICGFRRIRSLDVNREQTSVI